MTTPGWDPILDGTAAAHIDHMVREYPDGHWEVDLPDGTHSGTSWEEVGEAVVAWHRENGAA